MIESNRVTATKEWISNGVPMRKILFSLIWFAGFSALTVSLLLQEHSMYRGPEEGLVLIDPLTNLRAVAGPDSAPELMRLKYCSALTEELRQVRLPLVERDVRALRRAVEDWRC